MRCGVQRTCVLRRRCSSATGSCASFSLAARRNTEASAGTERRVAAESSISRRLTASVSSSIASCDPASAYDSPTLLVRPVGAGPLRLSLGCEQALSSTTAISRASGRASNADRCTVVA